MQKNSSFTSLRGTTKKLANMSFEELTVLFPQMEVVPALLLEPIRTRIYIPWVVFWMFLHQILNCGSSCQAVVIKAKSWLALISNKKESTIASNSSGYCKGRARLSEKCLEDVLKMTANYLEEKIESKHLWHNFNVKVADGSIIRLMDTKENQKEYPQQKIQKPGCGFPMLRILVIFSLATGAVLKKAVGSFKDAEVTLFRSVTDFLTSLDLLLYDRGLCIFSDLASLIIRKVHFVVRFKESINRSVARYKRLGKNDWLVCWQKPSKKPQHMKSREWKKLPEKLILRQVSYVVSIPGWRSKKITIITSLLDKKLYTVNDFSDLYRRRWMVELYLRNLKTTLGMEELSCLTPSMVRKELCMYLIAYNLIRSLIWEAASQNNVPIERISFKAAVTYINEVLPLLLFAVASNTAHKRMVHMILVGLAQTLVPSRPNRCEPRAVKRRPKPFQLLTAPRGSFRELPHRGKRKLRS